MLTIMILLFKVIKNTISDIRVLYLRMKIDKNCEVKVKKVILFISIFVQNISEIFANRLIPK